jgi:hypothetical protein
MTKITKISIITGLALIALGVGFFINTGMDWKSWTSLIPALVFGLPILVCGLLAQNEKRRMMVAHIAVLFAVLGVLGGLGMGIPKALNWEEAIPREKRKALSLLITAGICLFYVVACVRSFIAARKG